MANPMDEFVDQTIIAMLSELFQKFDEDFLDWQSKQPVKQK